MRKLSPFIIDSLEFYNKVVASKKNSAQDSNYTERLSNYEEVVTNQFKLYDDNFDNDDLVSLVNHGFIDGEKGDLIRLYAYQGKPIQRLKVAVTTTERNRILNTCQNCTIGEVNSFDHFVDKNEFPEFSVHPKNLFPCCSMCNSKKGQVWRTSGVVSYLNLYLDELPREQYLFVNIAIKKDVITTEFYLDNVNGVEPLFFERIQRHYDNLDLCKRFQVNAHEIITTLENTLRTYSNRIPIEDIVKFTIENSQKNMRYFGYNYWKSILEIALLNKGDFLAMSKS